MRFLESERPDVSAHAGDVDVGEVAAFVDRTQPPAQPAARHRLLLGECRAVASERQVRGIASTQPGIASRTASVSLHKNSKTPCSSATTPPW
jgi:hypothetical protein